jgi:hypothetical protein
MSESPSLLSPLLKLERHPSALHLQDAGTLDWVIGVFSNKRVISLINTVLLVLTLVMWMTIPVFDGERVTVKMMMSAKMSARSGDCHPVVVEAPSIQDVDSVMTRYTVEYLIYLFKAQKVVSVGHAPWWSILLPRIQQTTCIELRHAAVGEVLNDDRVDLIVWRNGLNLLTFEQLQVGLSAIKDAKPRILLVQSFPGTEFDLTLAPLNLKPARIFAEDSLYAKQGAVLLMIE